MILVSTVDSSLMEHSPMELSTTQMEIGTKGKLKKERKMGIIVSLVIKMEIYLKGNFVEIDFNMGSIHQKMGVSIMEILMGG
jgi:hypothetical protein